MKVDGNKYYARQFAIEHHGQQRYGELPYVVHLDDVASRVEHYGEDATVVAYLHDVVEDTSVSESDIEQNFGLFVAQCVSILTDEAGINRKERKAKTYAKMKGVHGDLTLALVVKAADRLANIAACVKAENSSMFNMYQLEHSIFKESVYRQGLCEDLWQQMSQLIDKPFS